MSARSTEAGFTVVELIAVLVLIGVLAVVALPRLSAVEGFRSEGWREQTIAGLRLAQNTAQSHRRLVCASFSGARLQLRIASSNPAADCNAALVSPSGSSDFSDADPASGGVTVTPAGPIYFQPNGRATLDAAGNQVAGRSLSVAGVDVITVRGESGHVE